MDLCVAPVVEHQAKQMGWRPVRRTLSTRIVPVYPCATHGPDVVCAVTAAADRTTHLAFTRGKRDVGHGKPYPTGAFRFGGEYGEAAAAAGIKSLTIYLTLCTIALGTFPIVRYNK